MMNRWVRIALLLIGIASAHTSHADDAASASAASEPKTLKERLGDKASDEQRVDNCKVPPERRGAKARPDACAR
ncbi:hypothetical protein [Caballeronia sp. GAWG1-5s-s]|uniref:hypothetical protein n=1 Tax=Caballeronia sp. GAWG1-5s-s TaxID=2921743 RepID=UPI002027F2FE|nr:hypothetical protein [Caballeronia sp. GAWG1-5s-s]